MEPPTGSKSGIPPKDRPSGAPERDQTTRFSQTYRVLEKLPGDPFSSAARVEQSGGSKQFIARRIRPSLLRSPGSQRRLRDALQDRVGIGSRFQGSIEAVLEDSEGLHVLEASPTGKSLREVIDEKKLSGGTLEPNELAPIIQALVLALEGIESPWRHGCLIPEHIYVDYGDEKALPTITVTCPFLAAALPAGAVAAALKESPFAPFYAPEIRQGLPHRKSDLYSVGAIAFEALSGRTPNPGETPRRELGAVGDAIAALLYESPDDRSDDLSQLSIALGLPDPSEPDTRETYTGEAPDSPFNLQPPESGFDPRETQVDVNAPKRFQGPSIDFKATQVDTSVPTGAELDTARTDLSSGRPRSREPDPPAIPNIKFRDLDPSLVRLALGADPASQDELVPTTPGTVESPIHDKQAESKGTSSRPITVELGEQVRDTDPANQTLLSGQPGSDSSVGADRDPTVDTGEELTGEQPTVEQPMPEPRTPEKAPSTPPKSESTPPKSDLGAKVQIAPTTEPDRPTAKVPSTSPPKLGPDQAATSASSKSTPPSGPSPSSRPSPPPSSRPTPSPSSQSTPSPSSRPEELLSTPVPTPELEAPTPPPDDAEATVEQQLRRRPEALARTMVDVRVGPGRRTRLQVWALLVALIVLALFGLAMWVREVRREEYNRREERRLQRKLERLEDEQRSARESRQHSEELPPELELDPEGEDAPEPDPGEAEETAPAP